MHPFQPINAEPLGIFPFSAKRSGGPFLQSRDSDQAKEFTLCFFRYESYCNPKLSKYFKLQPFVTDKKDKRRSDSPTYSDLYKRFKGGLHHCVDNPLSSGWTKHTQNTFPSPRTQNSRSAANPWCLSTVNRFLGGSQ